MKTLGDAIRFYRFQNKLSMREFSKQLGISASYVAKLERGEDERTGKPLQPSIELLTKIAKLLTLPMSDVLSMAGFLDQTREINLTDRVQYVANKYSKLSEADKLFIDGVMARLKVEDEDA